MSYHTQKAETRALLQFVSHHRYSTTFGAWKDAKVRLAIATFSHSNGRHSGRSDNVTDAAPAAAAAMPAIPVPEPNSKTLLPLMISGSASKNRAAVIPCLKMATEP